MRTGVPVPQIDDGHVLERCDQRDGDQQKADEERTSVGRDTAVEIEAVMITAIDTATAETTVSTVYRPHSLPTPRIALSRV